jgi:hypothetical protein
VQRQPAGRVSFFPYFGPSKNEGNDNGDRVTAYYFAMIRIIGT